MSTLASSSMDLSLSLNSSDGFVSIPVYQVWANEKSYGGSQAYYGIESVKVKETMRDLKGNATRAYVDISLKEVPAYQVNSGRDLASKVAATAQSMFPSGRELRDQQRSATAAADAAGNQGVGTDKPKDGPGTPSGQPASGPTTERQPGVSVAPVDPDR